MLEDAIDRCLARAEEQFDARIRELGGTPTLSPAQVDRLARQWAASVAHIRAVFGPAVVDVGRKLAAWGERLTSRQS